MNMQDIQNRLGRNIILTPENIAVEMVEALPAELWNAPDLKKMHFIDICCKGGVFLKALLNKLMVAPALVSDVELQDEAVRRKYILNNMLYGIAVCKLSLEVTRLNLYDKYYIKGNIRQITNTYEDYIGLINNKHCKDVAGRIKEQFGNMKFDVVIGNPPYNNQIYKKFILVGDKLSSNMNVMITPASWSDTKDEVSEMLKEKCKYITYYPDTYDCFDIKQFGGITWFVCIKNSNQECEIINKWKANDIHNNTRYGSINAKNGEVCLLNGAYSIIEKVLNSTVDTLLNTGYIGTNMDPYGVSKYFDTKNIEFDAVSSNKDEEYCIGAFQSGKLHGYIRKEYLSNVKNLDKYKLCVHRRVGFAALPYGNAKVIELKEVHGLRPYEIPILSEIILTCADSMDELMPFYNYYRTKFLRFLVFAGNTSSNYTHGEMWRFVPMQDFTSNSDIDWTQSVDNIDQQLYAKYNLTPEEISYIESTIKPMQ